MANITVDAAKAFMEHRKFNRSNTNVMIDAEGKAYMSLFGNLIATHTKEGVISITDAGWDTKTTKTRLNGLPLCRIHSLKKQWYLNGEKWNGEWVDMIWSDPICIMNIRTNN